MEPRVRWNEIILAAKIILLHFRRHVWNEVTVLAAKQFYFISDVIPCWNKIILKNFRPEPLPDHYAKTFLFHFRRGSMLK